ncbi:MAG TPA: hypothetical protein K8V08_01545 [Brevibacterium senegalense]|uniref:Uncharacterized protein n=1 Tax=Brevibacterium senegalense TaxID=1033736 RepID=A0A921SMR8_9MICO|nr:hypothetical protein [Brevibacterium senegalense]
MSPELLDWVTALGVGVTAALAGWPLTRWALHLAAGRDRMLTDVRAPQAEEPRDPEGAAVATSPPEPPIGASQDAAEAVDDGAVGTVTVDDDGLLRGGLWIGLLERLIIAGGVALGEPAVVGVVVAIKGLGRVPELLKSPTAGERFMIGSLASLGVALACGSIGGALIG